MSKVCEESNSTPDGGKENSSSGGKRKRLDVDEKESDVWAELRCPICLDHPHNAVLLLCSSHSNGCRPYICGTSSILSHCFHQFCKLHSAFPLESGGSGSDDVIPNSFVVRGEPGRKRGFRCPLCRGELTGWTVVESARGFMNELRRSCCVISCEFSGNHCDLQKHAENEHPPPPPPTPKDEVAEAEWEEFERLVHSLVQLDHFS